MDDPDGIPAPKNRPMIVPKHGNGKLMPPWTKEEQAAATAKAIKVKRVYTLRGALAKRLKCKQPNGERPWDKAIDAFVKKLLEGDVRSIELAMQAVDGPQPTARVVTHGLARDLVVRPDGDARGVIDVSASSPVSLMHSSDTDGKGKGKEEGKDGGGERAAAPVPPE